jgi:L-ribulose-5-phosphate 3-epimerase
MRPAIWTAMYYRAISATESLRTLHALGWDCFELSTEHLEEIEKDPRQERQIETVRRALEDLGAAMPQAHGWISADVAHPDATTRAEHVELLLRQLAVCRALGVRDVVIHPGTAQGYRTPQEYRALFALNVESFRRLGDRAGELGLRIGLENTLSWREGTEQLGATPEQLLELLAALDNPALGITFDSSHAHVQKLDLPAAIRTCGDKLICTHMSDNHGAHDEHLCPGGGTIDWPAVVAALRGIGYDGLFNLEIPGEEHPVAEIQALKVRHARAVVDWLLQ